MGKQLEVILEWFKIFHPRQYIYASVPAIGKPNWKTAPYNESLNPQELHNHWKEPNSLIGIRFGKETQYLLLDIDKGSDYHPYRNEGEFRAVLSSLEKIGLCRYIIVQSSASMGLHVYFPLPKPFQLWKIALLAKTTLEQSGFGIKPGQLENFPNYIPFIPNHKPLSNAHRLPLQAGSYLLDSNFQITSSNLMCLIRQWNFAAEGQDLETLQNEIGHIRSPKKKLSDEDIEEWCSRLETTIRNGWTANHQTQILVRDTCQYGIVFLGLNRKELEDYVLTTLTKAPGYREHCRHQSNIKRVTRDWIKTNEKSGRYYPLFSRQVKQSKPKTGPSNDEKREETIRKIREAVAQIIHENGTLPEGNTAIVKRLYAITRCSFSTLYKYRYLWDLQTVESCVIPDEVRDTAERVNMKEQESAQESCVIPCCTKVAANCNTIYETTRFSSSKELQSVPY